MPSTLIDVPNLDFLPHFPQITWDREEGRHFNFYSDIPIQQEDVLFFDESLCKPTTLK